MKRRTRISLITAAGIVVVVGAAAVIVGPRIYVAYASRSVQAAPTLTASPAAGESSVDPGDLTGVWKVGPHSFAGYRVAEVLEGQHLEVTGRTSKVSGDLDVKGLTLQSATVSVPVRSIATSEPARDTYFRNVALNVAAFPTATFTLSQPVTARAVAPGRPASFLVNGRLTLHGVTRAVAFRLQAELTAGGGEAVGRIPITFSDYGVTAPSLGFVTVQKAGFVEFQLDVVRVPPAHP